MLIVLVILSVHRYIYKACLELLYQVVHPLESTKPWSCETMTSLATLGKVRALFCFHLVGNNLVNVKCIFTTKYKQKQNLKDNFIFLLFYFFNVVFIFCVIFTLHPHFLFEM